MLLVDLVVRHHGYIPPWDTRAEPLTMTSSVRATPNSFGDWHTVYVGLASSGWCTPEITWCTPCRFPHLCVAPNQSLWKRCGESLYGVCEVSWSAGNIPAGIRDGISRLRAAGGSIPHTQTATDIWTIYLPHSEGPASDRWDIGGQFGPPSSRVTLIFQR